MPAGQPPSDVHSVSVVFPCYHDEQTIGRLVDDAHTALHALVPIIEVIVVDDASPDGRMIGRCYHHTVKVLFGLHVRDTDCDFRLFRRGLLSHRPLRSTGGAICVEMRSFEDAGARFVEAPVHHYFRPFGKSQFFRLPAIARSAGQLLQLWWAVMVADRRRVVPNVEQHTVE